MIYLPLQKGTLYPIVEVNVWDKKNIDHGGIARGLLDTGASMSVMKYKVFEFLKLELKQADIKVGSAGSTNANFLGFANMSINISSFMGKESIEFTFLVENKMDENIKDDRPWELLLGTNFLRHCNFEYKGREGTFGIAFLSKQLSS